MPFKFQKIKWVEIKDYKHACNSRHAVDELELNDYGSSKCMNLFKKSV